tara:strand:+ start:375 stop:707 length:333 start_codon:yes stop_codon:yes gene_type:complete
MKISVERLRQLIKEEVENSVETETEEVIELSEDEGEVAGAEVAATAAPPEEKIKADVEAVLEKIDLIQDPVEYLQLLQKVLQHEVPQKTLVLNKLLPLLKDAITLAGKSQ